MRPRPVGPRAAVGVGERERQVVRLRFGLEGGQVRTLEEVKEFGVTRERICQIESKFLAGLRHPIRSLRPRDYVTECSVRLSGDVWSRPARRPPVWRA